MTSLHLSIHVVRPVGSERRGPVGIDRIGLSPVSDHQVPIGRNTEAEMVEHSVGRAQRVCCQILVRDLVRHDAREC